MQWQTPSEAKLKDKTGGAGCGGAGEPDRRKIVNMNRLPVALVITFSAFAQRAASPAKLVFYRDTDYNGTAIHASVKIDSDKVTAALRK